MEPELFTAAFFNLGINILHTLIALGIGVSALVLVDRKLLKSVSIEQELQAGNMAVAVFASTILIFVALIVSFGLKG